MLHCSKNQRNKRRLWAGRVPSTMLNDPNLAKSAPYASLTFVLAAANDRKPPLVLFVALRHVD